MSMQTLALWRVEKLVNYQWEPFDDELHVEYKDATKKMWACIQAVASVPFRVHSVLHNV